MRVVVLAGEAVLTHAFEVLSSPSLREHFSPDLLLRISNRLARAAGSFGMIGGQVVDIMSEGQQVDQQVVEYIHRHKTGALIEAAVTIGGLLGGGTPMQVQALETYGYHVGWAFQIIDDILDVEGDAALLGKEVGRDMQQEKATYPALLGVAPSRQCAIELMQKGVNALASLGRHAERLQQIAEYVVIRQV